MKTLVNEMKVLWKDIKKGSLLLFLLSFLICSSEDIFRVSAGIGIATMELVETANYVEAAFPLIQYRGTNVKPNFLATYLTFNFNSFQFRQDQNIKSKILKQQRELTAKSYVLPIKKVIPFSLKEPLSLSC